MVPSVGVGQDNYETTYGTEQPLGGLVYSIVGLDQAAAKAAVGEPGRDRFARRHM